ncbi:MAG TPA: Gldg family protein [Polyangiaceae bacterium]|jgi:hypothetical protein
MALNDGNSTKASAPATGGVPAPAWVFPLYVVGMALVFVGERVLSGLERGAGAVTALGILAVLAATALRFSPRYKTSGERRSIEFSLALLSLAGVLGLCVYFATTDTLSAKLGLAKLTSPGKEEVFGVLRTVWCSLIALALVPMLFAETALLPMRRAERPESRRVRAAASAGISLVLAAIYGALFVYAASGVTWKADYSYFKTSKPSDATRKIAASLSEPVRVVAFFPDVNEVRNEVSSYLHDLGSGIPNLQIEIKDRLLVPKLAKELRASQDGVIILARGSVTNTVTLGVDIEQARPKLKTLDRDFKEQLLKLARARLTAYLSVGHGELNDSSKARNDETGHSAGIARTLLQKQNFLVKDLGLSQGLASDVPYDADVVIVLGPSEAFASEEIASLQRYADRGGHLLLALDPDTNSTQNLVAPGSPVAPGELQKEPSKGPNKPGAKVPTPATSVNPAEKAAPPAGATPTPPQLAALAGIAGLTLGADILANEKQHVRLAFNDSDHVRLISSGFSSHASVSTLSRNSPRAAVVLFGTGTLDRALGSNDKVDFAVRAPAGSFQDKNKNYKLDADSEKTGNFNVAAAVSRPIVTAAPAPPPKDDKKPKEKKPETKEMRAFVTADADAFSDLVMSNVIGNQILFVDAVRWLVGEESFSGADTSEEDVHIERTKQQDLSWFYATIFGAPCLVLGAGVFVSRRSRRARGAKR